MSMVERICETQGTVITPIETVSTTTQNIAQQTTTISSAITTSRAPAQNILGLLIVTIFYTKILINKIWLKFRWAWHRYN